LNRLAGDLLDLSRLDARAMPLSPQPLALLEISRRVIDELAARAEGHTVTLFAHGDAHAVADSRHTERILRLLLENAFRHTPPCSVVVSVSSDAKTARISVADAGPGIPAAELPQIFERFYRGESTVAFGSGLGLSIAHELAALMKATMPERPTECR
jgi:signal transduction histidine kinase